MATATIKSELAIVNIIGAVAVATALTNRCLYLERLSVTALTSNISVRAIEYERGLPIVIKTPLVPVDGVVA